MFPTSPSISIESSFPKLTKDEYERFIDSVLDVCAKHVVANKEFWAQKLNLSLSDENEYDEFVRVICLHIYNKLVMLSAQREDILNGLRSIDFTIEYIKPFVVVALSENNEIERRKGDSLSYTVGKSLSFDIIKSLFEVYGTMYRIGGKEFVFGSIDLKKAIKKDTTKLVRKVITNKAGKRQAVWVKVGEEEKKGKTASLSLLGSLFKLLLARKVSKGIFGALFGKSLDRFKEAKDAKGAATIALDAIEKALERKYSKKPTEKKTSATKPQKAKSAQKEKKGLKVRTESVNLSKVSKEDLLSMVKALSEISGEKDKFDKLSQMINNEGMEKTEEKKQEEDKQAPKTEEQTIKSANVDDIPDNLSSARGIMRGFSSLPNDKRKELLAHSDKYVDPKDRMKYPLKSALLMLKHVIDKNYHKNLSVHDLGTLKVWLEDKLVSNAYNKLFGKNALKDINAIYSDKKKEAAPEPKTEEQKKEEEAKPAPSIEYKYDDATKKDIIKTVLRLAEDYLSPSDRRAIHDKALKEVQNPKENPVTSAVTVLKTAIEGGYFDKLRERDIIGQTLTKDPNIRSAYKEVFGKELTYSIKDGFVAMKAAPKTDDQKKKEAAEKAKEKREEEKQKSPKPKNVSELISESNKAGKLSGLYLKHWQPSEKIERVYINENYKRRGYLERRQGGEWHAKEADVGYLSDENKKAIENILTEAKKMNKSEDNHVWFFKTFTPDIIKSWADKMKKEGGEHPFTWCVQKMTGNIGDPEGFCAKIHKEAYGMTPTQRKAQKKVK